MVKATEKKMKLPARPEHWGKEPAEHDYPAALDYLTLVTEQGSAERAVSALRVAPLANRKAKDLLRASRLALLPPTNVHVKQDLEKVAEGVKLSPVLLVRGILDADVPLTIADGYHRVCASYELDEDADIPCRIVDCPTRS